MESPDSLARQANLEKPIQPQRCLELSRHCFQKKESIREAAFILRSFYQDSHTCKKLELLLGPEPLSGF